MNKNLYVFLILFLGLSAANSLVNSLVSLLLGTDIVVLDSFIAWFVVANITAVMGSILLLKYFYCRNYRFAFFTGIITATANLGLSIIVYIILTSGELRSYYTLALLFSLCISIIYAAGLVFSKTRGRFWLKVAGVYFFVISVVLVSILIADMYSPVAQANIILRKIGQWASRAVGLVPILYMMNFLDEIKILNKESTGAPAQKRLENVFGLAVITALLFTVTLGVLLITDSYSKLNWQKDKAQQLVTLGGGARNFVDGKGNSLDYILIKPQNYDQQKKYPLVVCLPYGGYAAPAAELLSVGVSRSTYPAFIFIPFCPEGQGWGGIPGVRSMDVLVYETITSLAEPGIDVKRRYVTGVSRGAYGTWQFICTRPDLFAAAMPVSGGGNPKLAPKSVHVAVWAFNGTKDRNVPVSGSRDMIAAIKKAGGHPEYTEFPDEGHNIWDRVSKTPGLWDWLFAQKRE